MHTKLQTISFFQNSSFFVAWFPKNSRKKFLNQEFHGQLPEKAWSNGLFDFFEIVPLGAPRFSKDSKVEESICQDELTTNNDHQSFWNPCCSKLWNIFIFSFSFALGFILFLEVSAKFMMTKISETQVPSFHAYADIQQCLHISKVYENIHDKKKDTQKLPLIDPLS